jgi:hypothetical protein
MLTLICLSGDFAHIGGKMNGESEGKNLTFGKIVLIAILVIVAFFILKGLFKGSGNGGGLLSSNDCPTNLEHHVPKEQLKGVSTTMTAVRCAGNFDDAGNKKPYAAVTVMVNGKTNDGSKVRGIQTIARLQKKLQGAWHNVLPSDVQDSGLNSSGDKVGYKRVVTWYVRHMTSRLRVTVTLTTDKGPPTRASHIFRLP